MSLQQLEPLDAPSAGSALRDLPGAAEGPSLEDLPLHVRNVAALRGLGFTFREIGQSFGVSPQAASVMLSRHRALMKKLKRHSEMGSLSPRAVNCLGRLGVRTRRAAQALEDLPERLKKQRNCGQKTIREILDWAAG